MYSFYPKIKVNQPLLRTDLKNSVQDWIARQFTKHKVLKTALTMYHFISVLYNSKTNAVDHFDLNENVVEGFVNLYRKFAWNNFKSNLFGFRPNHWKEANVQVGVLGYNSW